MLLIGIALHHLHLSAFARCDGFFHLRYLRYLRSSKNKKCGPTCSYASHLPLTFCFQYYWASFAVVLPQAPACSEYKADVKYSVRMLCLVQDHAQLWNFAESPGRSLLLARCTVSSLWLALTRAGPTYSWASFACFTIFKVAFSYVKHGWGRSCIVWRVECLWTLAILIAAVWSISLFDHRIRLIDSAFLQHFRYLQTRVTSSVQQGEQNSQKNSLGPYHLPPTALWVSLLFPFVRSKSPDAPPLTCHCLRLALCIMENNMETTRHDLCFPVHLSFSLLCPCAARWRLQRWCSVGLILNSICRQSSLQSEYYHSSELFASPCYIYYS